MTQYILPSWLSSIKLLLDNNPVDTSSMSMHINQDKNRAISGKQQISYPVQQQEMDKIKGEIKHSKINLTMKCLHSWVFRNLHGTLFLAHT